MDVTSLKVRREAEMRRKFLRSAITIPDNLPPNSNVDDTLAGAPGVGFAVIFATLPSVAFLISFDCVTTRHRGSP